MKPRTFFFVALVFVVAVLFLSGDMNSVGSSALSRHPEGLFAARRYVEAQGVSVELLDEALADRAAPLAGEGVLVLTFPWRRGMTDEDVMALGRHLRAGGRVLLGFSGEAPKQWQDRIFEALGLESVQVRSAPPLSPMAWWRYHKEEWDLAAEDLPLEWELVTKAFRWMPEPPESANVWFRGGPEESREAMIYDYPLHRGRVLVLPSQVLSNLYLRTPGNAHFLQALVDWAGDSWIFAEYQHGLVGEKAAAASFTKVAWDLFLLHLMMIYLLGLWALGHHFGPAWREPKWESGSTVSFFKNLGALHHRMGHHRQAAQSLLQRVRLLNFEPSLSEQKKLQFADEDQAAAAVRNGADLVAFARRMTLVQGRRKLQ